MHEIAGVSNEPQWSKRETITLSPSGAKDDRGEYHNAYVNLYEDELSVAGMAIRDDVFVRVRDGKIIIQKVDQESLEHEF